MKKLSKDVKRIKRDIEELKKDFELSPDDKGVMKLFESPLNQLEAIVRDQHKKESKRNQRVHLAENILEKIDDIILSQEDALNTSKSASKTLKK